MQMIAVIGMALLATALAQPDIDDATAKCFEVQGRRNQKDLYASPTDCHDYIQCFYMEDGVSAKGYTRTCPLGQFFHEPVLSCMPEGTVACVDRCLDETVNSKGCYAGLGCSQYYACSNTGSYGMCCPKGTAFVEATCSCEVSETCTDSCIQQAPPVGTTVAPPNRFNATVCEDSFGSFISSVPGRENAFSLIDSEGNPSTVMTCPNGYSFSLRSCRCDIESGAIVDPIEGDRQAVAYFNFDGTADDRSNSNFEQFFFDGAALTSADSAHGAGSLAVSGGRSEVPGFKTFDSRNHGSWCSFFRCSSRSCNGGILSNNKDSSNSHFTFVFGVDNNVFSGQLNFWSPVGKVSVSNTGININTNSWNQFCVTFDSNKITTYINGNDVETQFVSGFLSVSHAPLAIGNDQSLGSFTGHVDEVLITPFAMTSEEVTAHYNGDFAALGNRGFWQARGFMLGDTLDVSDSSDSTDVSTDKSKKDKTKAAKTLKEPKISEEKSKASSEEIEKNVVEVESKSSSKSSSKASSESNE